MVKFAVRFVLFVLVLSGSKAYGQVCTAYLNASDGDDSNPGTQTSPHRSFEFAYSTLAVESVVCIAAGEYFFGDDADGISLSTDGKGMTFVLNAFAGDDEIRFSESFFEVNVGNATIKFLQGSTSKLILGEGVVNTDDPASPELFNFLHTIRLISGSLDISDVDVTIEASVGAPAFVNPLNPAKIAPDGARIEYGDVQITGNLIFEPAERTILFSPSSPAILNYPLPANLFDNRLIFSNSSVFSAPDSLAIQGGTLIFRNRGPVTFENAVSLDPENGSILLESSSADVQFADILSFQGSQTTGSLIQHSGSGRLTINTLQLIFDGIGSDAESSLRIDGDGEMEIIAVDQQVSGDGSKLIVNLIVDSGTLLLGSPSQTVRLPGALMNRDHVELNGPVELGQNGQGISLDNSGSLSVKSFRLSDTGAASSATIDGLISGNTNGVVEITGTSSWTGSGTLPGLEISGTGILGGTLFADGSVTVRSGAHLELTPTSTLTASGSLFTEASATVVLLSGSTMTTSKDVSFSGVTISLADNARLVAEGNVDVGSAMFQDRSGWIEFVGTGARSLSGTGTLSLPGLSILGVDVSLGESANIREVSIAGGSLSIVNGADLTVSGNTSVTSGTIVTPSAGTIEFNGPLSLSSGTLDFTSAALVRFLSDADWVSGTAVFSNGGVEFAGDQPQTLMPSPGSVLPRLTIVGMSTLVNVTDGITVEDDLSLDEGTLALASGITLSLKGNLTRTNGTLEHGLGSALFMTGVGTRSISGFSGKELPSLHIDGPDLTLDGDVTISGSLVVSSGSFRVPVGSRTDVSERIQLLRGSISIESGATLRSGNDMELSGGTFSLSDTSTLDLGSNLIIGGTTFTGDDAGLRFSGAKEQSFSPGNLLRIGELVTSGIGTKVLIVGPEGVDIRRRLVVGDGTEFDIGDVDVIFSGELPAPGLHVDGTAKSNSGIFKFIGPTLPGTQYLLSGGGVFGSISVALTSDTNHLLVTGSSPSFRFSGEIYFQSGSIDVAGKSVVPSTSQAFPGIRRNMQDKIGPPGNLDGGGFFDSESEASETGDVAATPGGDRGRSGRGPGGPGGFGRPSTRGTSIPVQVVAAGVRPQARTEIQPVVVTAKQITEINRQMQDQPRALRRDPKPGFYPRYGGWGTLRSRGIRRRTVRFQADQIQGQLDCAGSTLTPAPRPHIAVQRAGKRKRSVPSPANLSAQQTGNSRRGR
ncbi:MAG: hypothetical protein IH853_14325 [Bacteroidetes bacterium]|nr:hypothetical protein [Bacteroidota bacterium]